MRTVDTHAHIFAINDNVVENARYTPASDASPQAYLAHLDAHGFDCGVLVQPSFLGFDNRQMLAAIAASPERLKGIAVIPRDTEEATLQTLTSQGIVGARLNLFGQPLPDLSEHAWQRFLGRLGELNWQLELHCPPAYLRALLPGLASYRGPVVIDHFGRVDPAKGVDDPDYQAALELLEPSRHWIKISGYYRLGPGAQGSLHAKQALALLLARGLRDRLVWGSDWPHTQHDDQVNYEAAVRFLHELVPEEALRLRILGENAQALYGFAP